MGNQEVINWIQKELKLGIPLEKIKVTLLKQGWTKEEVDNAIYSINNPYLPDKALHAPNIPDPLPTQNDKLPSEEPMTLEVPKMDFKTPKTETPSKEPITPETKETLSKTPKSETIQPLPQQVPAEPEKKPKFSKAFLLIFSGSFVIAVLVVISLIMVFSDNSISNEELAKGKTIDNLKQGDSVKFLIGQEEHTLTVDKVGVVEVQITLRSTPTNATLKIGESQKFDLNGDWILDLEVTLEKIDTDKAIPTIVLRRISEVFCIEDWACEGWNECINDTQTRICQDDNECRTTRNKPIETQECTELTCAQKEGIICNETEACNGSLMNAFGTNKCCQGTCVENTTIGITPAFTNCGTNFTCFMESSKNCSLTNVTFTNTVNANFFGLGIISTTTKFIEIKGIQESKCIFYQKTESSDIKLNNETVQQLLSNGSTQQEIDDQEALLNQNKDLSLSKCKINTENLESYLEDILETNVSNFSLQFSIIPDGWIEYTTSWGIYSCAKIQEHSDPDCTLRTASPSMALAPNVSTTLSVYDYTSENNLTWMNENMTIVSINPTNGSSTTTVTGKNAGSTTLLVTDNGIGSHCNIQFQLTVS